MCAKGNLWEGMRSSDLPHPKSRAGDRILCYPDSWRLVVAVDPFKRQCQNAQSKAPEKDSHSLYCRA